jgi:hypothetical protein
MTGADPPKRRSRARYKKGGAVGSIQELMAYLDDYIGMRCPVFYFGSCDVRPIPWIVLRNMQFGVIEDAIRDRRLWYAITKGRG